VLNWRIGLAEAVTEMQDRAERRLTRRLTKSNLTDEQYSSQLSQLRGQFQSMRKNPSEADIDIRPVKFGMDREIEQRVCMPIQWCLTIVLRGVAG
jgi:hypothetical protein